MAKKLGFEGYFGRGLIIFGLLVFVTFLQTPLIFIKTTNAMLLNISLVVLYFGLYAVLLGLAWHFYKKFHQAPVKRITGNQFVEVLGYYVGFMIYQVVLIQLSIHFFNQSQSANNENIQKLLGSNSIVLWSMMIGIVLLSPILEELIFRGMIVDGLFKNQPVIWPMLFSGILFALLHANSNIFTFLVYAGLGAALVLLYRKTGTIQSNILLHIINNAVAAAGMLVLLLK